MKPKLTNKTALITGGAQRIGRALALALAENGCNIIVHYHRSVDAANILVTQLNDFGVRAVAINADLKITAQVENLFAGALAEFEKIDYLINNAAIYPSDKLTTATAENLQNAFTINAHAPLILSRLFAQQKNATGAIINLLDTRLHSYDREHFSYHLSKRDLYAITKMLAVEYAPQIRVNGLALGLILPPVGETDEWLRAHEKSNPLQRYGAIENVSAAVLFLLHNDFITGEIIHLDGGRHLRDNFYG